MQIIQELTLPTMSLRRVLINGSMGRMGQESIKAVSVDPELELVAQTDLGDNFAESIDQSKAHVVVDFTTAASALKNTVCIIESGARPVIGTSEIGRASCRERV